MRGEPFYEYFKSKMTSLIIVLIVVVVFFAFSGSRVVFYTSSTHESSSRCASIASTSAVVKHLEMVAPMDDLKAAGMLRQCGFCSSASQFSSKEVASSYNYSSHAMTQMAVNDSKYERESIGLFDFGTSEVPELLREGRGCDEFQGVVAPSCDTDPGAQSELVLDAFDDVHGGDISEVASAKTPEDSRGVVISPSASDILIFLQIKPRPRDKPGSSLALVPYRLNYREEIPCDPVEAINGGELVGASLQALEEMVSDFVYLFVVQSRIRFLFYLWN